MLVTGALSLLAGVLTVLAPCVLPFLPIIVGGSLTGSRWRPYVVCASLVASLVAFSILLKATTILLDVDPAVWSSISGALVIALGATMLFPDAWAKASGRLGFGSASHRMLESARSREGVGSAVLTGAALGPVFSSCSPTYAWVVATILPVSPIEGMAYLAIYCVGLAVALLAISLLGRRLVSKLTWASNPSGWFQRVIAVLFIVVGLLVATGVDRKVQTALTDYSLGIAAIEEQLVPDDGMRSGLLEADQASRATKGAPFNASFAAPELTGIENWINSDPLTLSDLRGQVVLIDFWTYSCINCQRTQPYLNAWYERYRDRGFRIIGVHAPEFAFEKLPENVRDAVAEAGIEYPVALDNAFATWRAYGNRYWPAKYLVDRTGVVRFTHFGEGSYEETEDAIRSLLGLDSPDGSGEAEAAAAMDRAQVSSSNDVAKAGQTPETYFGLKRAERYAGEPALRLGEGAFALGDPARLSGDRWALGGRWSIENERIVSGEDAQLAFRFSGRRMHLVLGADSPRNITVEVGDRRTSIAVDSETLYTVVELPEAQADRIVRIGFEQGVSVYAATFGS